MGRLAAEEVACWVLKTTLPPADMAPRWSPTAACSLARCVRPSYRLGLIAAGQPCLLWLSGRHQPGVHALGRVIGPVTTDDGDRPVMPVRLVLLPEPVPRGELLTDNRMRNAEVLRMPAGSNPSWLSAEEFSAVLDRTDTARLGRWST